MGGRYLLDSNVAILALNGQLDLEGRRNAGIEIYLCLTVVGELLFGAARSGRPRANRSRLDQLLLAHPPVPHDLVTAEHYGELKAELAARGRPIPDNDIWIAAAALQHDLTLVTRDRHFDAVGSVRLEAW